MQQLLHRFTPRDCCCRYDEPPAKLHPGQKTTLDPVDHGLPADAEALRDLSGCRIQMGQHFSSTCCCKPIVSCPGPLNLAPQVTPHLGEHFRFNLVAGEDAPEINGALCCSNLRKALPSYRTLGQPNRSSAQRVTMAYSSSRSSQARSKSPWVAKNGPVTKPGSSRWT